MPGYTAGLPPEFQHKIDRLEEHIRRADELEQKRKVEEALAAYKACFDLAVREGAPFFLYHLTRIWMGVGFCYANRNQWKPALQMYHLVESALQSAPTRLNPYSTATPAQAQKWARFIPPGLQLLYPEGFDPDPDFAAVYESIGLAYENSNQVTQAMDYYRKSVGLYTRLGDDVSAARVWHCMAVSCQRRADWPALEKTARRMLELYQTPDDTRWREECLVAWRFLAQASWNQGQLLDAIESLRLAVEAGQVLQHPDLAKDQKRLDEFRQGLAEHLSQRQGQGPKPNGQPLFDHAKFQPLANLFTRVAFEKVADARGGESEYEFVLRTKRFEDALRVVRVFHLTALPVNLACLRQNADPKAKFPKDSELWIEWYLADVEPGRPIDKTIIPAKVHIEMANANLHSRHFKIVLEEEKLGFLGKPRRELIADHAPFVLDWRGLEGSAVYARSAWQDPDYDHVEPVLDLLTQRLDEHGPAAGLYTQMGLLYGLIGKHEQAIDCYAREIEMALQPNGRPGFGALAALCHLGAAFKQLEEFEFARAAYRLALTLNPNYYEPLVSLPGLLEDFGQQLLCLSRAYRLRPDDPRLAQGVEFMCEPFPHAAADVFHVIKELSQTVDLTRPLPELTLTNPAAVLRELLPEIFTAAAPPPNDAADADAAYAALTDACATPASAPAPYVEALETFSEPEPVGPTPIHTVNDAEYVLVQFARSHLGPSNEPRWGVGVEAMKEFGKNGALRSVPGAVLPLSPDPEQCIRVTMEDHTCVVHIMQEFQIPNTPHKGLKPAFIEKCAARADALLDLLNSFVMRGLLVKLGNRLLYFDPA